MKKFYISVTSFLATFFILTRTVHAHVGYVVPEKYIVRAAGGDISYLLQIFSEPINYIIVISTFLFLLIAYTIFTKVMFVRRIKERIESHAKKYDLFVSWIIRLSLGITLIGAGVSYALVSPAIGANGWILFAQTVTGFLLLAGFLLTPAVSFAIIFYLIALTSNIYVIGNLDFLAMSIVFLILANPRPGIDDLIGIPQVKLLKKYKKYVPLIVRTGFGVVMIYLSLYEKIFNPHLFEQVVINYSLTEIIPVSSPMWVFSTGSIEFIIGLLIFIGFRTRIVSVIAFVMLSFSFFYFKESVYSHVTLFSALGVLFIVGSGKISIDNYIINRRRKFFLWK